MDSYIFIAHAGQLRFEQLSEALGDNPVLPLSSGSFQAIVIIRDRGEDSLGTIDAINAHLALDIQPNDEGKLGESSTASDVAIVLATPRVDNALPSWWPRLPCRWIFKAAYTAFVRVHTRPGMAVTVAEATYGLGNTFRGVAVVAGSFDVLVELGSATFAELTESLFELNGLAGVRSTETSLSVDLSRFPPEGKLD